MELRLELRNFFNLLGRYIVVVVLSAVVGGAVGFLVTPRSTVYRTSAMVYVGPAQLKQDPYDLYLEVELNETVATYARIATGAGVMHAALAATGAARSVGQATADTQASVVPGTSLLTITESDRDPTVARDLATGIARAFVHLVQSGAVGSAAGGIQPEPAFLAQAAAVPTSPQPTGLARHVVVGLVFGLVASVLLVLLLDYLDVSVRSAEELERRLGTAVLAVVPEGMATYGKALG